MSTPECCPSTYKRHENAKIVSANENIFSFFARKFYHDDHDDLAARRKGVWAQAQTPDTRSRSERITIRIVFFSCVFLIQFSDSLQSFHHGAVSGIPYGGCDLLRSLSVHFHLQDLPIPLLQGGSKIIKAQSLKQFSFKLCLWRFDLPRGIVSLFFHLICGKRCSGFRSAVRPLPEKIALGSAVKRGKILGYPVLPCFIYDWLPVLFLYDLRYQRTDQLPVLLITQPWYLHPSRHSCQ